MRILLVDDQPVFRLGFRRMLEIDFPAAELVEAGEARQALAEVRHGDLDLVVLDLALPGMPGMDAVETVARLGPGIKILVYTRYSEAQYVARAIRAGASGYVTRDSPLEEVVHAVCKVLDGCTHVCGALAERLASRLAGGARPDARPHELLSDREEQVLRLLGAGRTVKEIGVDLHLSVKTVSTYRTRILDKLKVHGTAGLIRYAVREGLLA